MEQGVCRVELALKVGDQVRGQEVPEAGLGEEAERARVAVQEICLDSPPVLQLLEGAELLIRLAPFEAALQKSRSRKLVASEGSFDLLDDGLSIARPMFHTRTYN